MNEALRSRAIDITRRHLIRQGSRRVSMDMIAREMRISKRTLYLMFTDKRNLVGTCITEMRKDYERKVQLYLKQSSGTAWENFNWLLHEYLQSLYDVDYSFLLDIKNSPDCNESGAAYQQFWQSTFEQTLEQCRREGVVTDEFAVNTYVKNLLGMTNKSRIEGVSWAEQENFCRILVRGIVAH